MTVPDPGGTGDVAIPARDGMVLAGTLFRAKAGERRERGVIVGSAMGVKRSFYTRFAIALKARGYTVLTFDYRGIGGSPGADRATLRHWGERDLAGAIDWLGDLCGGPVGFVGHSVSGQMLGLAGNAAAIDRIVLVAAQSGDWRLWPGWRRWALAAGWCAVPAVTRLYGRLPGWLLGGSDLPAGVAREWARWGRTRDYMLAAVPETRARFAAIEAPLLAFAIDRDPFAPVRAVEALAGWFGSSLHDIRIVGREASPAMGHFGFFDRTHANTHWREVEGWLAGDRG
jgi:predicted alpha/beta hydrolase